MTSELMKLANGNVIIALEEDITSRLFPSALWLVRELYLEKMLKEKTN